MVGCWIQDVVVGKIIREDLENVGKLKCAPDPLESSETAELPERKGRSECLYWERHSAFTRQPQWVVKTMNSGARFYFSRLDDLEISYYLCAILFI